MYAGAGGVPTGVPVEFTFPSGAKIRTGHLKDENAYTKYQGHEYHRILIEELTQIPDETSYLMLISSCRSTVKGLKPQIFCTTNPGGAGHEWVKKRFKTGKENQETWNRVRRVNGRTRVFIPARVEDNPALMDKDPDYVKFLESLPEDLRKAWREGSWDDPEIEGAVYKREMTRARLENRITKVPHDSGLRVYTWWDLGYNDKTAIGFFQRKGNAWCVIDYYENSGQSLAHYAQVLDQKARTNGYNYDKHFGPHDIEAHDLGTGLTRQETLEKFGYYVEALPKRPIDDGIQALRIRFSTLLIEESLVDLIRALDNYRYQWDSTGNVFKKTPEHDWTSHAADMMRMWAMTPEFETRIINNSRRLYETRANKQRNE